jgi:predicted amidohydrolase YtcJ
LAASTRGGSTAGAVIEPGARADLALIERDPLVAAEAELRAMRVRSTLLAGRITHLD